MSYHIRVGTKALIIEDESILLIEYDDQNGLHYNLPGRGVDPGESIIDSLKREVKEEAAVDIEVGPLLFVGEYEPIRNMAWAGSTHKLTLFFECRLADGARPQMPIRPDPHQTAVKWIKLADMETVELLPHIANRIIAYAQNRTLDQVFLEEPIMPERVQRYLKPKV